MARLDFASLVVGKTAADPADMPPLFKAIFEAYGDACFCEFDVKDSKLYAVRATLEEHGLTIVAKPHSSGTHIAIDFGNTPVNEAIDAILNAYAGTPVDRPHYWFQVYEAKERPELCVVDQLPSTHQPCIFTQRDGLLPRYDRVAWARFAERVDTTGMAKEIFTNRSSAVVTLRPREIANFVPALTEVAALFTATH